jgi:hypothetical protein
MMLARSGGINVKLYFAWNGIWQYNFGGGKMAGNTFEPRKIAFERTAPYGWYVVVFPRIHDESRNVEMWLDRALDWLRRSTCTMYTWGLVHGLDKKDKEITSPVMYFKDRYDALRFSWNHSGTLQE